MRDRKEYYREWYRKNRDKKLADYYFKRYGIKLKQRRLPLPMPEIKLVKFYGIKEVEK